MCKAKFMNGEHMKLSKSFKISKLKICTMAVNFLFFFAAFSYMIFNTEDVKGDTNQITNISLLPKPGADKWTPCSNTKIILTCTFTGTTMPRAFVRWTTDNWWHTKDTDMVLIEKSGAQLKYEADLGNLGAGTTVKYCACIYTSTETKWANNNGWNYELYIQPSEMVYPSELTHTPYTPKYNEKVTFKTTLSVESSAKVYLVWTSDGWTNIHEDEMTLKTVSENDRTYQVIKGPFTA
jgi:hypothetical protein